MYQEVEVQLGYQSAVAHFTHLPIPFVYLATNGLQVALPYFIVCQPAMTMLTDAHFGFSFPLEQGKSNGMVSFGIQFSEPCIHQDWGLCASLASHELLPLTVRTRGLNIPERRHWNMMKLLFAFVMLNSTLQIMLPLVAETFPSIPSWHHFTILHSTVACLLKMQSPVSNVQLQLANFYTHVPLGHEQCLLTFPFLILN